MIRLAIAGILVAAGLCGCTAKDRSAPVAPEIDGVLDDAAWEQIPSRSLVQPRDRTDAGRVLLEKGACRFFYADGTLYLSAEFADSLIVTAGDKDGDDLYHGDCCEIFIKPAGQPFYWEIWISPDTLRSVATWRKKGDLECKGRLLDGREIQLVTGTVEGFGWMLEAAIPLPKLSGRMPATWEILVARQNYDETLSKETRELSSFPVLGKSNFHRHEEYFRLGQ